MCSPVHADNSDCTGRLKPGSCVTDNWVMDNVAAVQYGKEEKNGKCIDYTNTKFIVKSTFEGKKHVKKVNVEKLVDKCTDLQQCLKQQTNALGFLPITQLDRVRCAMSLKPNMVITDKEFDPVKVHNLVRQTGCYNFQKAKIQLPSKINFEKFEEMAAGYWDWQLPYSIKYGFPLDFLTHKEHELQQDVNAHTSATQFSDHVDSYLKTEIGHKAIYGPYTDPPYGKPLTYHHL